MEDEAPTPNDGRGCFGALLLGLAFYVAISAWLLAWGGLAVALYGVAFVLVALGLGVMTMAGRE